MGKEKIVIYSAKNQVRDLITAYSPIKYNYCYKKWQKSRLLWFMFLPSSGTDILSTRPDYSDSWWSCSWSFLDYCPNYKLKKKENTMITKDTLVTKAEVAWDQR